MPTSAKITLTLTEAEAEALLFAALAGQYEYCDAVRGDPGPLGGQEDGGRGGPRPGDREAA